MTYLDFEYANEADARAAVAELEAMDMTGEWHLVPLGPDGRWRLSLSSEKGVGAEQIRRLGGTLLGGAESAADEAHEPPASLPEGPDPGSESPA